MKRKENLIRWWTTRQEFLDTRLSPLDIVKLFLWNFRIQFFLSWFNLADKRGGEHPKQQTLESNYNQYKLKKCSNNLFQFTNGVNFKTIQISQNFLNILRDWTTTVKSRSIFFLYRWEEISILSFSCQFSLECITNLRHLLIHFLKIVFHHSG